MYQLPLPLIMSGDSGGDGVAQLLSDMGVVQVPKFMFFRGGQYLGRFFGSNRQDVVGQVRQLNSKALRYVECMVWVGMKCML